MVDPATLAPIDMGLVEWDYVAGVYELPAATLHSAAEAGGAGLDFYQPGRKYTFLLHSVGAPGTDGELVSAKWAKATAQVGPIPAVPTSLKAKTTLAGADSPGVVLPGRPRRGRRPTATPSR